MHHLDLFLNWNKYNIWNIICAYLEITSEAKLFNSLDDLRIFVQIFEKKSLTVVAALNHTTPGVISKRLTQIEKDFGDAAIS